MLNSFQTLQPNSVAPSLYAKCDKPSGLGFNFMKKEIWLPIQGATGYEISTNLSVRSWNKEAALSFKIHPSSIGKVLQGKNPTAAGYCWEYALKI